MYFAYVLKSLKDDKYYYGSTDNLDNRLKRHNQGYVRSTKSRRPLELIYKEEFATRSEAYKRELYFKSVDGYIWLLSNGIIIKK